MRKPYKTTTLTRDVTRGLTDAVVKQGTKVFVWAYRKDRALLSVGFNGARFDAPRSALEERAQ